MAKSRKPSKAKAKPIEEAVVVDEVTENVDVESDVEQAADVEEAAKDEPAEPVQEHNDDDGKEAEEAEKPVEEAAVDVKPKKSGGVFIPMLLGGAIAAAGGFGAARYPDQWPFVTEPAVDPVATEVSALSDRIAGLEAADAETVLALDALKADDGLTVLRGETTETLDQMKAQFEALSTQLADLESRIHTVEKLPQGSGMEAAAAAATAYERELQQMRAMLDAELATITAKQEDAQTLEVSAAEAAKSAGARAAMSRVMAALETGQPFEDALFDLTENAGVKAPAGLADVAAEGVPSLSDLQSEFPDVARVALDASIRSGVEDGSIDRVTAFFRTQLGTRSLEPKEGDDPDAILSRAEAALRDGQIGAALSELEAMPDTGKPALEGWISNATARNNALTAAAEIAQSLNTN